MSFPIPICLSLAKRRIEDAAFVRHTQPFRAADADFMLTEAVAFLEMARKQGLEVDPTDFIEKYLLEADCDFSDMPVRKPKGNPTT